MVGGGRVQGWFAVAVLALAGGACAEEKHADQYADAKAADAAGGDTADAAAGDAAGGGSDTAAGPAFKPFVAQCSDAKPCPAGKLCSAGVCVPLPDATLKADITDPMKDYLPTADPIELGCVGAAPEAAFDGLKGPTTVTMWGRVDRFGGGGVTSNVEVAVFKLAEFHPEACAAIEDDDARATCFHSDKVGKPVALTASIDPDEAQKAGLDLQSPLKAEDGCERHLQCPSGYECRSKQSNGPKYCIKTHGTYALDGVPTNTRLVVRVRGLNPKDKWHDSYYWDTALFSDRIDDKTAGSQPSKYAGKDTYRSNPTIVGEGQWTLVPNTIGIQPIDLGHGVVGGRIRDCGKAGGRGGWAIHNAKVGLGVLPKGLAFFNDNEDNTVPVKTVTATDTLGRFAAVDLPAGPNRVAAAGWIDGKAVPLGGVDVFVIPDALMIVSLPGRIPVLSK